MPPIPPAAVTPDLPAIPQSSMVAEAPGRGTGSGGTLLPTINGDQIGGSFIAGPLPVVVPQSLIQSLSNSGQPISQSLLQSLANSSLSQSSSGAGVGGLGGGGFGNGGFGGGGGGGSNTSSSPSQSSQPSSVYGLFPQNSSSSGRNQSSSGFGPQFDRLVSRIPQIQQGAFKITENESPMPMTRAYVSYYYYDEVGKNVGGPSTPRMQIHQEVFGGEYAFLESHASVGVRLPYTQLVGGTFYNDTSLGDLTFIGKYVLGGNPETGDLLSVGMAVTVPTASTPFPDTITGQKLNSVLIQPYTGYILTAGRGYFQGFTAIVVPTDSKDVTFISNDWQLGYVLVRDPGAALSALVPTFECHINTPLIHRGAQVDPVGMVDSVILLGGIQMRCHDRIGLGVSAGSPVTGPQPFSLQATVQLNAWF
jgi:hypothetical protein